MTPDTAALRALADEATAFRRLTTNWHRFRPEAGSVLVDPDTVRALCDAADEVERLRANGNGYLLRAHAAEEEAQRLRDEAADNWRSWEREAGEHARTLGLIGAPKTGEPLSEGEQRRYEAAVERGLRKRAEDQRDASRTAHAALVADLREAEVEWHDAWSSVALDDNEAPVLRQVALAWLSARAILRALLDRHAPTTGATP